MEYFSDPYNKPKNSNIDINAIIDNQLYMSDVFTAENLDLIKSLRITHIVTVSGCISPKYPDKFIYKVIKIDDSYF